MIYKSIGFYGKFLCKPRDTHLTKQLLIGHQQQVAKFNLRAPGSQFHALHKSFITHKCNIHLVRSRAFRFKQECTVGLRCTGSHLQRIVFHKAHRCHCNGLVCIAGIENLAAQRELLCPGNPRDQQEQQCQKIVFHCYAYYSFLVLVFTRRWFSVFRFQL